VLLKHLGGLSDERSAEVINNTQVNVITDEQRVAPLMSLLARAKPEARPDNGGLIAIPCRTPWNKLLL